MLLSCIFWFFVFNNVPLLTEFCQKEHLFSCLSMCYSARVDPGTSYPHKCSSILYRSM